VVGILAVRAGSWTDAKRMKKTLLILSAISLSVGVAAWIAWSQDLLPGSGSRGEDWERWSSAIKITWRIIDISFPLSILLGISSVLVKPRSRGGLVVALSVTSIATLVAVAIWLIVSHLGIQ
jgi:hypothetical protein